MTISPRLAETLALPDHERRALLASLEHRQRHAFKALWDYWAADPQREPAGDWRVWLVMAGRGFGKTRAGAEWVRAIAKRDGNARIALIGANLHEARSVMVEGTSGILAVTAAQEKVIWEPSLRRLAWPGGARALIYSAAEPESLRGPEHSHAWCDEIGKWEAGEAAWTNMMLGLRRGELPRVLATTTPRPTRLVRGLVKAAANDGETILTGGRTHDNFLHLPQAFLDAVTDAYGDTRLGRQEIGGELIEDIEGSLWPRGLIEDFRVPAMAPDEAAREMRRIVVAVDPPAGAGPGSDACGIIVAGVGHDGRGYVLDDASVEGARPEGWARAVAAAFGRWRADRVIAEANQGGAMVASVLKAAANGLPVRLVHASRAKSARAEPVAALYEIGSVSHAGAFPALEDQLAGMTISAGYQGPGQSPDRADALVWAMSELMLGARREPGVRGL